jgi:hypothetical protein
MDAPASLSLRSGDGTTQRVVERGAALPARGKVVFATSRAGQASIELELLEDDELRVASAAFELPRGLPANCWIPVFVEVGPSLRVRAQARENLRRVRVDARFDPAGATARHYQV